MNRSFVRHLRLSLFAACVAPFIALADDPPVDTDGDGLSDSWELAHGMNPNKAAVEDDGYKYEYTVWEDAEDGNALVGTRTRDGR